MHTTGPGGEKVTLVAPDGPISDTEAKNRREIEAAWLNTWRLYETSDKLPSDKIESSYAKFTTGKALQYYVEAAKAAQKLGFKNVGEVRHRLSWGPPVGNFDDAGFIDCMDQSNFGYVDTRANQTKMSKPPKRSVEVSAHRESGVWKVSLVRSAECDG